MARQIAEILGHTDPNFTVRTYTHTWQELAQLERVCDTLAGLRTCNTSAQRISAADLDRRSRRPAKSDKRFIWLPATAFVSSRGHTIKPGAHALDERLPVNWNTRRRLSSIAFGIGGARP
jgi:hypothetical protein